MEHSNWLTLVMNAGTRVNLQTVHGRKNTGRYILLTGVNTSPWL